MAHKSDYNRTIESTFSRSKDVQDTRIHSTSPRVNGKLILRPNAFYRTKIKGTMNAARYSDQWGSYKSFQHYPTISYGSGLKAKVIKDATEKFYSEVGGIKSNLVDMYRTRAETASMVANRLKDVAKAARAVRKGNFKRAQDIFSKGGKPKQPIPKNASKSRPFSQNWLEWSYGWSPLLGDIYTLCNGAFPDIIIEARIKAKDTDVLRFNSKNYSTHSIWEFTDVLVETRCVMQTEILLKDSAIKAAADLGLTNPAVTLWEAVPWSFVVDWVLPIGDWLESFTSLSGLEFRNFSQTTTTKISVNGWWEKNPRYTAVKMINSGNGSWNLTEKDRRTGYPPSYPLPRFKNPFSTSHLTNAIALYRTSVKK